MWWRSKKAKDCNYDVVNIQRCVCICFICFSPVPAATRPAHPPSARRHAQSHHQGNQAPSAIPTHNPPSLDVRWSGPTGRCLRGSTDSLAQSVNDVMRPQEPARRIPSRSRRRGRGCCLSRYCGRVCVWFMMGGGVHMCVFVEGRNEVPGLRCDVYKKEFIDRSVLHAPPFIFACLPRCW